MAYYIGSREFDDLQGDIALPTPMHDVESRAGQDGLVVFASGTRGREFELVSEFHAATWADAVALQATYYSEPSLTPLNIIRGTETYASTSIRFVVLAVSVSIKPRVYWNGLRSSGRVGVSPAFSVMARWRMVAVVVA